MRDGWPGSGVVRDGWPGSDVVRDGWPGSSVVRVDWLGSSVVRDGWLGSGVVLGCGGWVRCGDRAEQDAGAVQGALAFFPREKILDKLCKSILDWKQEITQEAARDRRRRRGRDASTASGEQSSASSPRGEGLGLAQNLPNEKTCMEGWLPCTFRVRWGFRRGGPGLTQPKPDAAGAYAGRGPCAKPGPPAGQLCWPWAG